MQATGFMQRSGTMSTLNSEIKQKLGFAGNNQHRGIESYINKPLKATSGALDMEK